MNSLRWIHLSDIHYCYNNYQTEWLRDKLLKKISSLGEFDILFITGDLLYKCEGNFSEVGEFIKNIIECIKIDKKNVLIVPGNHDFPRSRARKTQIIGACNTETIIKNSISNIDETIYNNLLNDQQEFFEFYRNLLGKNDKWKELHFITEFDKCNVVSLNTCLVSGRNDEEGKLSINLNKLLKVLKKIPKSLRPNIAIGHHSIECFDKSEQNEIIKMFDDYGVDLYLCGHMHQSKYEIHTESKRDIQSLVCGSAMVDGYAEPSFIIGEIDLNSYKCNIKYYLWSEKLSQWNEDNDISRKIIEHEGINFYLQRLSDAKKKGTNANKGLIYKRIDELTGVNMIESKFQKFLLDFCKNIQIYNDDGENSKEVDVEDKFEKMKCTSSFQNDFDSNVEYFGVVDHIFLDPSYISYDRKTLIPGVIRSVYKKSFSQCKDGDNILDKMVDLLCDEYGKGINIPRLELEQYFRTIIFWSINKCTIYNDTK